MISRMRGARAARRPPARRARAYYALIKALLRQFSTFLGEFFTLPLIVYLFACSPNPCGRPTLALPIRGQQNHHRQSLGSECEYGGGEFDGAF